MVSRRQGVPKTVVEVVALAGASGGNDGIFVEDMFVCEDPYLSGTLTKDDLARRGALPKPRRGAVGAARTTASSRRPAATRCRSRCPQPEPSRTSCRRAGHRCSSPPLPCASFAGVAGGGRPSRAPSALQRGRDAVGRAGPHLRQPPGRSSGDHSWMEPLPRPVGNVAHCQPLAWRWGCC